VKEGDALDLTIILDITGSMQEWIVRSKTTINSIIDNVVNSIFAKEGLFIRVSFIGYRDIADDDHCCIKNFSENVSEIKEFISKLKAAGCGGDIPEDVSGGLQHCLD
jgi:hypothetical protein